MKVLAYTEKGARRRRRVALAFALAGLGNLTADASAQSTPQTMPAFEVATIKPQTDPRPPRGASSPDRFNNPDATLRGLIEYAYELTDAQIVGGPDWTGSRRFAIDAKAVGTPSRAEMRLLVRTLLAQRFNLKAHTETRELPVYILERIRPDGPLGPALRATPASECAAPVVSSGPPREPGSPPPCGVLSASPVRITARGVAMSQFSRNIRDMGSMTGVDRIVIDRTGLDGYYSFEFGYRPTETAQLAGGADNPTLFDAVREQLGLKLTPTRAPVSVLVIDSATLPTPD
jgi:uncharacterized protein (TIGR03435 family)